MRGAIGRSRPRALPADGAGSAATDSSDRDHRPRSPARVPPQFFSRAERAYRRVVYRRVGTPEPASCITISQYAAETIIERLGIPEERVRPIHLGIDHELFRPGDEPRGEFLLYPAREWPHKNHVRLFAALAELRRERPGLELVLTAYEGPVPEGVRSLGRVSTRGAGTALPNSRRSRLPEPLRGLRPTAARGDGLRLPCRVLERRVVAGGRRRRSAALRSDVGRRADRRSRRFSTSPSPGEHAASRAPPGSRGSGRRAFTTTSTSSWRPEAKPRRRAPPCAPPPPGSSSARPQPGPAGSGSPLHEPRDRARDRLGVGRGGGRPCTGSSTIRAASVPSPRTRIGRRRRGTRTACRSRRSARRALGDHEQRVCGSLERRASGRGGACRPSARAPRARREPRARARPRRAGRQGSRRAGRSSTRARASSSGCGVLPDRPCGRCGRACAAPQTGRPRRRRRRPPRGRTRS